MIHLIHKHSLPVLVISGFIPVTNGNLSGETWHIPTTTTTPASCSLSLTNFFEPCPSPNHVLTKKPPFLQFLLPSVTTPSLLPSKAPCAANSSVGPLFDFDKNISAQAVFWQAAKILQTTKATREEEYLFWIFCNWAKKNTLGFQATKKKHLFWLCSYLCWITKACSK